MFACVSFPISSFKTFTYSIPKSLNGQVLPGSCVNASINHRIQPGFVVSIQSKPGFDGKILDLDSIRDKELHLPEELWKTLDWVSRYYITPLGKVLKAAVPNTFLDAYKPQHFQFVQITEKGLQQLKGGKSHNPSQKRLLITLSKIHEPVRVSSLSDFVSSPHMVCKSMAGKGWVHILRQPKITDPFEIMAPGNLRLLFYLLNSSLFLIPLYILKTVFIPAYYMG